MMSYHWYFGKELLSYIPFRIGREDKKINKKRLIIVSNREPYSHEKTEEGIICRRSVGGVVSALDPLMQERRGIWIAWGSGSADFIVCNSDNEVLVPNDNPKYILKRVELSKDEIDNYYQGFSNRVLWPLFHLFIEKMHIKEEYWNFYRKVNEKFAKTVIDETNSDDLIWIHDYQLSLVPYFIRKVRPNAKIALFWHIPWPPWEIFDSLPQRDELLEGILESDLIGFHAKSYVRNFIECAIRKRGVEVDAKKSIVKVSNNKTKVRHFPLGICYKDFAYSKESQYASKNASQLKERYEATHLILGVDRLDYTKGILKRLKAFELFLEENPQFRKKAVLAQVVTPSRYEIEEYNEMKKEIDETVGQINGRFGTEGWTPIKYFYRKISQQSLLEHYEAADVALLTPLRDGMNLVAKEYIASKEKEGVLILSEFAGASEGLNEAITVNPYDIQATAGAIKIAVEMPAEEKRQRFQSMKKKVKERDADWWLKKFLKEWEKIYA